MMHRRIVVQLSRRHGADWTCAAKYREAAFAPVYVPRRSFRSSLTTLDSSESSSSATANEDRSVSGSSFGSKFGGGRWGAKQTQRPAALSAAEQTLRDSLVARKNATQNEQQDGQTHGTGRRGDDSSSLERHNTFGNQRRPAFSLEDRESRSLRPDESLEVNTVKVPKHLRSRDWICPECQYNCFGKHLLCPCCRATRPDIASAPPKPGRRLKNNPESTLRIRKLGQSFLSESDNANDLEPKAQTPGLDGRARALNIHLANKDGSARTRPAVDMKVENVDNAAQGPREERGDRRQNRKPKAAAETEEKDPWSWDQSSLQKFQTSGTDTQRWKEPKRREGRKQRGSEFEEEEFDELDDRRRRRDERKRGKKDKTRQREPDSAPSPLYLPEFISVSNLADVIGVRPSLFVQRMEEMGFEDVTYSHILDAETAGLVATEFNFEPIFETADDDLTAAPEPEDKTIFPTRPPVVTIMGHVDHGKTTILDWLRKSSVAASEHGGITQHIGAFSVSMPSGKTITFLDTPGHAAFLAMRRRGADVTDIVVLVVAADDSVKPQTIEAIKHATGSNVPIIVAMSKIDKENINIEKVKQDLSVHGVHVEDYGGDVQAIGVSGKTGQGMLELEEAIVTLSEVLDHRADTTCAVEGWVIEATTKSYGRVATTLIRRGTLRPGDIVVAGSTWARVRTLRNEAGVAIPEATPGMPVEIDGWRDQPTAGAEILQANDEQHAKEVVEYRQEKSETQKLSLDATAINEARREQLEKRRQEESEDDTSLGANQETITGPKPVHFIIKADVGGSAEAVLNSVAAIGNNEVFANVLRSDVGPVSEFDVEHAATASGHIVSFNMSIDPGMLRMAELRGVKIMDHNIIYKLIDEVKDTLSDHLTPLVSQRVTGEAEVGQIFEITLKAREKAAIAGCKVRNGIINRARKVRVLRGQETVYDGSIVSLKNVKKDVTEMRKDTECGISFEGWTAFEVGDHIQCYEEIYEKRHL